MGEIHESGEETMDDFISVHELNLDAEIARVLETKGNPARVAGEAVSMFNEQAGEFMNLNELFSRVEISVKSAFIMSLEDVNLAKGKLLDDQLLPPEARPLLAALISLKIAKDRGLL